MEKMDPQSIVTDSPQPSPSMPPPSEPSQQTMNKTEEKTEEVKEAPKGTSSNESVYMICPHCHTNIYTRVVEPKERKPVKECACLSIMLIGYITCCIAVILAPITGCCLLFCPDNCDAKKKHYCPECDSYLGKY